MPIACFDLLRGLCRDNWRNDLNGDLWGPKMMLELIFLDRDCEAGCNTLLVYYPKYPLMCEICAVAICDSGYCLNQKGETCPKVSKVVENHAFSE